MSELSETVGLFAIIIGSIMLFIWMEEKSSKLSLSSSLIAVMGLILITHPTWGTGWLFLKNAVATVPFWVWVVVGITVYFNLNKIYASWLDYANKHPESLAEKILGPPPIGLPIPPQNIMDRFVLRIGGVILFCLLWLVMLVWLIFGGIAKLLHLVPRERE